MMDLDHIIQDLVPNDPNLRQLDVGKGTMQFDVCTTMKEVTANLAAGDRSRPVFFYSLPQNVHISMASQRAVPEGESYPGFFAPVASSVRRLDGCLGGFVDDLKRANLYDDSIIILTSDHGDSLGEEGRWGHAHFIIPEVMRIPLIIHLPSWMKSRVSADLGAVTFSTDITPSLYALLGYEPADLGSFFGRPLFVSPDADTSWRRRERFLLASSYGTVYGTLRHNGRRLFVVDAIDGRDTAFDIGTTFVGQRLEITQAMIADNRGLIREELTALARRYGYPGP
jgi:arylsulfatase A-like enzyme